MPDAPILVLVPHDPDLDPRVRWVNELCEPIAEVHVVGSVLDLARPQTEDRGRTKVHRLPVAPPPMMLRSFAALLARISGAKTNRQSQTQANGAARRVPRMEILRQQLLVTSSSDRQSLQARLKRWVYTVVYFLNYLLTLYRLPKPLSDYAPPQAPRLIICHELYGLIAGVKLKRKYGCPLIYDSHELWPEYDLQATRLQKRHTAWLEGKLCRHADVAVAVSEPIGQYMQRAYKLGNVLVVPNAEPMPLDAAPPLHTASYPVRFLFQGGIHPGRGIDELLDCWSAVHDSRAVLVLRGVEGEYYTWLQQTYTHLINEGRVIIAPPVAETDLVRAAYDADVGVIPYTGPSLNHVYACPNKLSQYAQAGLAILACADLQVVSQLIEEQACGLTYDPRQPSSLLSAVTFLLEHPDELSRMKQNAYAYACSELNWQVQSRRYAESIAALANQR